MPDLETPERIHELPVAVVKNMVVLSTSGLGVVVALAWNALVQKIVETYIAPYFGTNSGVISLFIYAVAITFIAIVITMWLTHLQKFVAKERGESRRPSRSN